MQLLPYNEFLLFTRLSRNEIRQKLESQIDETPGQTQSYWGTPLKPYRGKVTANGFIATRIIGYRNSFNPVVEGEFFDAGEDEQEVHMRVELPKGSLVMVPVIAIALGALPLLGGIDYFLSDVLLPGAGLLIIPLLFYALILVLFRMELKRSKKFFADLLNADIVII